MKHTAYREQDYAFGQRMLTLRAVIGLTQAGLAEALAVSRRSVADWEAGGKYPKVEHLKLFIELAVKQQAFHVGHEAEEIRSLWKAAHQKVFLDEYWLADLLSLVQAQPITPEVEKIDYTHYAVSSPAQRRRMDWGDALAVPNFYGREWELAELTRWVVEDGCRLVGILGLGGIGKSALSVSLMHQVAERFEVVIWRSLRDAPTCEALLDGCLQVLAPQPHGQTLVDFDQRLNLVLESLRTQRALLVLDNLETLLEEGESTGRMRPGYEDYERLLDRVGETAHQSCVLFTSREKPVNLTPLEGSQSGVRMMRLARLETRPCEQLLTEKGVSGTNAERARLIDTYAGNPLALKIVARTIVDLFDGEIAPFLAQGEAIFGGIRDLLAEQFDRLSALEQSILLWLAIMREPATLDELLAVLVKPVSRARLLEVIEALHRRSLIERGQLRGSFTLQSVVLEYAIARLINEMSEEIYDGKLERLIEYGLELAHAHEYVRQTQERLIAAPILAHLHSLYQRQGAMEGQLKKLLNQLTTWRDDAQGYAPANLVVLLRLLRGDLRGVDLSGLVLRGLYLQGVEMQDAHLVNATIQDGIFTEAFDALTGVAISSTGEYWAASSRRGEIRIWEAGGHLLRRAWRGHMDMAWALAFSPDGRILASGSSDNALKLWDVASGGLLWSGRHTSFVNRVVFSPDGLVLASAGNDATVGLWDVASGTLLQTLPHPQPVASVIWSPNGHLLASGDMKGRIRLWVINQIGPIPDVVTLTGHTSCVDGLAFAPDGYTLASGSWDGTVKLWEVSSGHLLQTLRGHTDRVLRVAWSPDGSTLASSSMDQTILLWDVEQRVYRAVLKGHTAHVYQVCFTPDSRSLLSGSRDGTLRVWDVASEQCVEVIRGYADSIYDVDWSPDGSKLVSGGNDLRVTLWDVMDRTPLQVLQEHTGVVCAVGWSPDGRWLASSETEHGIRLWDLTSSADFRFLRHPDRGGNYMYRLAWSSDGRHLASGSHRSGVMIWDVITGEEAWIGRQFPVWFPLVAWSPDGKRLACGGDDGIVYILNVTEDSLEQRLLGHHSRISSLAWSPDGKSLASGARGAEDGELFIWNVQSGQRLHSLVGHVGVVSAVAWDASGERLISGGGRGILRWWDVQRGERLWEREAHNGTVQSLRRGPDGTKLASCGDDGTIMLWDLQSGEHLQTLRRDRPYERLNITRIQGLTEAQKANLRALGAVEDIPDPDSRYTP